MTKNSNTTLIIQELSTNQHTNLIRKKSSTMTQATPAST